MRSALLFALLALPSLQEPPKRGVVALKGAKIYTMSGAVIDAGTVVLNGRVIAAVGKEAAIPAGATVIDCSGKVIIPGLIDVGATVYVGEGDAMGAADQDAYDAIDPFTEDWKELVAAGVTAVYVNPPNRGPVNGLGAILRLTGSTDPARLVARRAAALKLTLGVGAAEQSTAQQRYQDYRTLKSVFESAKAYRETWEKYHKDLAEYGTKKKQWDEQQKAPKEPPKDPPKEPAKQDPPKAAEEPKKPRKPAVDRRQEAVSRALDPANPLPVRIEAHTRDSIEYALKLADEFKLKLLLEQGTEAVDVAPAIAKAKVPVLVGPVVVYGMRRVEYLNHSPAAAAALSKAGVEVAVGSFPTARAGHSTGSSRFLLDAAAITCAHGLSKEQALKAITIDAARLLGVHGALGSLDANKRADLVVLDGEPFESTTRVVRVFVDGETLFVRKE